MVLESVKKANLYLKPEKRGFHIQQIKYRGLIINYN